MSTKATGNKKHLTLADRAAIEHGISRGENFTQIACRINKDSSTISKEIRRHLFQVPHFQNETQRKRSECEHFQNCEKQHICGNQTCNSLCWKCRPKRCSMYCPDFTPRLCEKLKKPPYVCNDCPQIRNCSHDFYFYRANYANDIYSETKSSSRSGINQTPESLEQLDRLVSPLLLQGQHNTGYRKDRSYLDFERYLEKFPDTNVVELDVVEAAGGKSEKVLLTMLFRNCSLMLIFLMDADRKDNVEDVFQRIYTHLGADLYRKLFPVILTDNGASFKDPAIFERPEGELLSRVFYCDPMASWQKGRLEKNHEFIRYIIPKGTTFAGLDQEQVTLITNHINSVARASLNGCTPFELALLLIDRKLLDLCQLERIPANQVILKPSLLKK